jgi:hypothetical protein
MAKFKYLEATVATDENDMKGVVKSRLNSGNAYYDVGYFRFFCLLVFHLKAKRLKQTKLILPIVFCIVVILISRHRGRTQIESV